MTEAIQLVEARKAKVNRVCIAVEAADLDNEKLVSLAAVLRRFPGNCTTELSLRVDTKEAKGKGVLVLGEDFMIEASDEMLIAVERLFGRRVVIFR